MNVNLVCPVIELAQPISEPLDGRARALTRT
jgi:hypothetical protein